MPTPEAPTITQTGRATSCAEVVASFERFYSAATFYPPVHTKCREALQDLNGQLAELLGTGQPLVLEPREGGVLVQGEFLDQGIQGAGFAFELLDTLGIARFELDRDTPLEQLHQTIRTLNNLKLESESSLQFHTMDFSALPRSIRIVQREFGWGRMNLEGISQQSGGLKSKLDLALSTLREKGWSEERVDEFRQRVEETLARVIERVDRSHKDLHTQSALGRRSLEEVLELGASAISRAVDLLGPEEDDQDIRKLFRNATDSLSLANDSRSVQVMLEVLQEGEDEEDGGLEDEEPHRRDDTEYSLSAADLVARLHGIRAGSSRVDLAQAEAGGEILAIGLQMLTGGVPADLESEVKARVSQAVAGMNGPRAFQALGGTLDSLLGVGDRKPIDAILPWLLPVLARRDQDRLAIMLEKHTATLEPGRLALLWPHLAELAVQLGQPAGPHLSEVLARALAALPGEQREQESGRLRAAVFCSKADALEKLFQLPGEASRLVLEVLLGSSRGAKVGARLHRLWSRRAPSDMTRILIELLGPFRGEHRGIYLGLLQHSGPEHPSPAFRREATRILALGLKKTAAADRNSARTIKSIELLGRLGQPAAEPILRAIVQEKKMRLFPVWPGACRSRAHRALAALAGGEGR